MQHRTEAVQQSKPNTPSARSAATPSKPRLRQNRDRLSQIALEIDRGHARRRTNEERCAELIVRTASAEAELAQAQHRLTALEAERESQPPDSRLRRRRPRRRAAANSLSCQQEAAAAAANLAELEREQEAHRASPSSKQSRPPRNLRNQLTQAEERLAGIRPRSAAPAKPKSPPPTRKSKPSADNAASLPSNSKPSRSASAA